MARGKPALWSSLLGLPFIIAGIYVYLGTTDIPLEVALPLILFGGFVVLIGLYVHLVATPEQPRLGDNEEILSKRHPTQRVAAIRIVAGLPLLASAAYLFFFTLKPYVYPTIALIVGLYLFSGGLHTYWTNTLTTYYVTTERVVKEYRFISLLRQEIPLTKVRGVREQKSIVESLVGLGNVSVASGGGKSLAILIRDIEHSAEFADELRNSLPK